MRECAKHTLCLPFGGVMKEKRVLFQIDLKKENHRQTEEQSQVNERKRCTQSIWRKTSAYEDTSIMSQDQLPDHTEVLIIGGGMAGILTAYELKARGIDAIVIDRGEIARSCTAHTTAKITSLHGAVYQKISRAYGAEKALQYYESQQKSIEWYREIIQNCNIACDFEMKSHIMFATEDGNKLKKEYECMKQLGIDAEWTDHAPLPFEIQGGIIFHNQAQFHPLRFIDQLIEGMKIYPHCQATRIDSDGLVEINHSVEVKADSIVIATHYPIINSKGFYFTRLDQERSYAIALRQPGGFDIHDMYIDMSETGHSFRPYQDFLIMVCGNHRTGKKNIPDYYQQLEAEAARWFPGAKVEYHWSNQDCMSVDHLPYIGAYSKSLPNFYVATGFNQWGISNSMVASHVITDLIVHGKSEYEELYSPTRHQLSGAGSFLENGAISVVHLVRQLLHVKESELNQIGTDGAGIVKYEGKSVGVYKDQNGQFHMIDTKCPHLGCQLEWNRNEKTWDCPCHGSRFDIDGHLIEDPAQKDLDTACCMRHKK